MVKVSGESDTFLLKLWKRFQFSIDYLFYCCIIKMEPVPYVPKGEKYGIRLQEMC